MSDTVPSTSGGGERGQVIGLLRVIVGLLAVIAIVLLLILVRGPEDPERSGAWLPAATSITA
jgi:hypothetical protein